MKTKSIFSKGVIMALCVSLILSGCGPMNQTKKGTLIGAGGGAALGAVVGALIAKDAKGAAIGAAIGTAVGGGTGAVIGHKMDKKQAELAAALEDATVETVTDANNLQAIKVTFDNGILFKTGKADLSADSKKALETFATQMKDLPDTDFTIQGHTDNTGSREINDKLSLQRAQAVGNYLRGLGIASGRLTEEGLSWDYPVADNNTEAGRKLNRRVEVYITANEAMIKAAEQEASQAK